MRWFQVNVGAAAHITAAAPGGARYDAALKPEQRSHILNAIWLCQNCAKLIDNDPSRYTAALLGEWKARAELQALQRIGKAAAVAERTAQILGLGLTELVRSERYDIVKLDVSNHALAMGAEYAWMEQMYPGSKRLLHAGSLGPPHIDMFRISLLNGKSKEIHFAISSFLPGDPSPKASSFNEAIQEIISRYA